MIICCLDQSTKITGYSIWNEYELVDYGIINLSDEKDLKTRMDKMYEAVLRMLKSSRPDFVCLEETQYQSNQRVYKVLSQMQGMIFAACHECCAGYVTVEPSMWKSYVQIKSRKRDDQKKESMQIVKDKFNIDCPTDDLSDSICIGLWATNMLK